MCQIFYVWYIDVLIKHAWIQHLKDKTGKTILHGFAEISNESKHNPNKLWVGQGREFTIVLCNNDKKIMIF